MLGGLTITPDDDNDTLYPILHEAAHQPDSGHDERESRIRSVLHNGQSKGIDGESTCIGTY